MNMIYWCKPFTSKCEWIKLKPFVEHYNSLHGKSYSLSRCLDIEDQSRPEPEILLEARGEIPVVIEHKSIVWPDLHLRDHQNEHTLFDHFSELVRKHFQDDLYQLTVAEEYLHHRKKGEILSLAKSLVEEVLKSSGYGHIPFPWRFERVPISHRLPDMPPAGVGIQVISDSCDNPEAILKAYEEAKTGFRKAFERAATGVAKKFANYPDHRALLVLEFYGADSTWVLEEDLLELIRAAELRSSIDEVWITQREWFSDNDFELAWERAR
jgi:hypothetical protein